MKPEHKRRIATWLRRMAHKPSPESIDATEVTWHQNDPPHVDIRFRHGKRVIGYVDGEALRSA
jgi:hypothetical protein